MRLLISISKNSKSIYVIKDIYTFTDGKKKRTSKIIEKLGTYEEIEKRLDGKDPISWAKKYIEELNLIEKEAKKKTMEDQSRSELLIKYSTNKQIEKNAPHSFNCGYLFLQQIYNELNIPKIIKNISQDHKSTYDLNQVLSRLVYSRILFPASKNATLKLSKKFLESTSFDLQHIYRGLDVIGDNIDYIQSEIYKNNKELYGENSKILYYDCTNYYFEIEQEGGLKQYGLSKEHRPNPIVQMGLFMNGDGLPLAFVINKGNTNEQVTLKPLEEKIINDFKLSKFVVCTDSGLSSNENRKFNSLGNRAFITTQSLKKLKNYLKKWSLSSEGWRLLGSDKLVNITSINYEENKDKIYYKERWINTNGFEQRLIVSFSPKYLLYQRNIRTKQVERALKILNSNPNKPHRKNKNDPKRFIKVTACTDEGEVAGKNLYCIDKENIERESQYDGFYAVCTNLEDNIEAIINVNRRRWEIEESFRIMKTEFKARPVHLQKDNRIEAHFMTCFISLLIYRILENKLENRYTCDEIISTLKNMNLVDVKSEGFIPTYTRNNLTDALHDKHNFRLDYEIIKYSDILKIFDITKKF